MEDSLWPWLAIAAAGAVHGTNPVSGWPVVAWRARMPGPSTVLGALWPIAVGHVASMSLLAGSIAAGAAIDRGWAQAVAALLLVAVAGWHVLGRRGKWARAPAGPAGLTLWSFFVSTGHGAGLMLVPALIPLCTTPTARPDIAGPVWTALATVAVHTVAMLLAGGAAAGLAVRGWRFSRRPIPTAAPSRWTLKHRNLPRCSAG